MIFDLNDNPVTENEYQQRLLSAIILVVMGAGGQVTVTREAMADLQDRKGKTYLNQETDGQTGDLVLTVGHRP